jgi:hypothetical protein
MMETFDSQSLEILLLTLHYLWWDSFMQVHVMTLGTLVGILPWFHPCTTITTLRIVFTLLF